MTQLTYSCSRRLRLTVVGPTGETQSRTLEQPFARIGADPRLEVVAAQALRFGVLLIAGALIVEPARADVIVLANRTAKPVRCELVDAGQGTRPYTIEPGDLVAIPIRGSAALRYTSGGKPHRLELEADSAYFFHTSRTSDDPELDQIGLGAALPTEPGDVDPPADDDPPAASPAEDDQPPLAPAKILVKLLVDDNEPAARPMWEKRVRKRMTAASDLLERHCGVKFEVVAVETWKSNDAVDDFTETMEEFERVVDPQPARIAIGFCSQFQELDGPEHLGGTRGPLHSHILLREWSKKVSEPERLELLIHELGHFLGGVHSPERNSVMRPTLGDRQALARSFRVGFDPLNSLAMAIVGEELRERDLRNLHDVGLRGRSRLAEIYSTLVVVLPEDPVAADYLRRLEPSPVAGRAANGSTSHVAQPRGPTNNHRKAPDLDALVRATQTVLGSIVAAAQRNVSRQAATESKQDEPARLTGEALTELYVREAATSALNVAEDQRVMAMFVGIAVGLDRSDLLRKYAVLGDLVKRIEPDEERELRLKVLGNPTMRGRYDLTQHFVISGAIAVMAGAKSAETVGLAKEKHDAEEGSGFSFVDWCADLSGIALAKGVLANEISVQTLAASYRVGHFLPYVAGLPEGLTKAEFTRAFGSTSDPRFRRLDAEIRRRIKQLFEAGNKAAAQ